MSEKLSEPLVERLHQFFVRVFTTYDLFDKDKRQEMKLESFALDDEVSKLEAEIENLKKDQEPFRAQIDQRKTYKGPDD